MTVVYVLSFGYAAGSDGLYDDDYAAYAVSATPEGAVFNAEGVLRDWEAVTRKFPPLDKWGEDESEVDTWLLTALGASRRMIFKIQKMTVGS